MNLDDIDDVMRAARPPVVVSQARIDGLAEAVLARIEQRKVPAWWNLPVAWAPSLAVARLPVLLVAAALLGVMVGNQLEPPSQSEPHVAALFSTTSAFMIGS